jgi:hypothetical protein
MNKKSTRTIIASVVSVTAIILFVVFYQFNKVSQNSLQGQALQTISVDSFSAIGDGQSHPISEWLVGKTHDRGYANLVAIQKDYPFVQSLQDEIDWVAVQSAFNAAPNQSLINFTSGRTYLLNNIVDVADKSLDIDLTGATIKMASNTVYNAFYFHATTGTLSYIHWKGGTIDGNKDNFDWPGTSMPGSKFIPIASGGSVQKNLDQWANHQIRGNNGLLGIMFVDDVLVSNLRIINPVSDGVVAYNPGKALFVDCQGQNGAPLKYAYISRTYGDGGKKTGKQATFFKVFGNNHTGYQGGPVTFKNITVDNGSIGLQYSAPDEPNNYVPEHSDVTMQNITIHNMVQNGIHIEQAHTLAMENVTIAADGVEADPYIADIHIGNMMRTAILKNINIKGGEIDFNEGSSLVVGDVINSKVVSTTGSTAIEQALRVIGSEVWSNGSGINANDVEDSIVHRFTGNGIGGAKKIKNVLIDNTSGGKTGTGIQTSVGGATIENATISNVATGISARGSLAVSSSKITSISGAAIVTGTATPAALSITNNYFDNFGLDATQTSFLRAGIGGKSGASAAPFEVRGNTFIHSATEASLIPIIVERGIKVDWTNNNLSVLGVLDTLVSNLPTKDSVGAKISGTITSSPDEPNDIPDFPSPGNHGDTVDSTPPAVSLKGSATYTLTTGTPWSDPGATAMDNIDGDLTSKIKVSGSVDTNTPGDYKLLYTVKDAAGNETNVTRTIIVYTPQTHTGEGVISSPNSVIVTTNQAPDHPISNIIQFHVEQTVATPISKPKPTPSKSTSSTTKPSTPVITTPPQILSPIVSIEYTLNDKLIHTTTIFPDTWTFDTNTLPNDAYVLKTTYYYQDKTTDISLTIFTVKNGHTLIESIGVWIRGVWQKVIGWF